MAAERILVSLIHHPVYVLGPGRRVGLWTQGCSIRCRGCMSKHAWEFDETKAMSLERVAEILTLYDCERLTISGGEPFDQPEALLKLLKMIRPNFKDILLYTGYRFETIEEKFSDHLELIDAVVDSPFIEGLESDYAYKGSENQRLFVLNPSLRDEYDRWSKLKKQKLLQIKTTENGVFIIGVPYQRDVEKILSNLGMDETRR
uniref:Radical SAM protein n=1 Tax=Pseudothermotoga hypogea TaxID=57487 RepID=A0A832IAM3_9THEM